MSKEPSSEHVGQPFRTIEILPRERYPIPDDSKIQLPSPGSTPSKPPEPNWMMYALTPVMSIGFAIITVAQAPSRWWIMLPMLMIAVLVPGGQWMAHRQATAKYNKDIQARVNKLRQKYEARLGDFRGLAHKTRDALDSNDPTLLAMRQRIAIANDAGKTKQIWGRSIDDSDFLQVRIGLGTIEPPFEVTPPRTNLDDEEDPCFEVVQNYSPHFASIPECPLTVNLRSNAATGLRSSTPSQAVQLTNTIIGNIVSHHNPADLQIFFISHRESTTERKHWQWLHWLPHCNVLRGSTPSISLEPINSEPVLSALLEQLRERAQTTQRDNEAFSWEQRPPHLLLIIDSAPEVRNSTAVSMIIRAGTELDASALFIESPIPRECTSIVDLRKEKGEDILYLTQTTGERVIKVRGTPDFTPTKDVEEIARMLAGMRSTGLAGAAALPDTVKLVELLNATTVDEIDLAKAYREHENPKKQLVFAIGKDADQQPLDMRLKEAGKGGFGSHAMLAGMQGTGKSILLQSIVLSLAATHSPTHLNLLLADFKGGAAELKKLAALPHVVGYVTDLNARLAERSRVALNSEIVRRKRIMENAANTLGEGRSVPDIWAYNEAIIDEPKLNAAGMRNLPHLVIVLDEFAEGLKLNPALRTTIDTIAAQGRALGIHLILSTQRPDDFDDKIRANIDYRLCLRVSSREDSMRMLKRPDASRIDRPGRAYLQVGDDGKPYLFQAARADQRFHINKGNHPLNQTESIKIELVHPDGRREKLIDISDDPITELPSEIEYTANKIEVEAEALVQRIRDYCATHPDKDPLPTPIYLEPLPVIEVPEAAEFTIASINDEIGNQKLHGLRIPLGKIDLPHRQQQEIWWLDLAPIQGDGHLWLVGASGAGREYVLQSIVKSLAIQNTPNEIAFYMLDFGQGQLQTFTDLAHCGAVIGPDDNERLRRLLKYLKEETRIRTAAPEKRAQAIVVVIDGFSRFRRDDYIDYIDEIADLAQKGAATNIHLVITSDSSDDIQRKVKNNIVSRIALRLNSMDDYVELLGKRVSEPLAKNELGRGYIAEEGEILELQLAFPETGVWDSQANQLAEGIYHQRWEAAKLSQRVAFEIRALPTHLPLAVTLQHSNSLPAQNLPIGLEFESLKPANLDLDKFGPFALVIGPAHSGKTEFLISLALTANSKNLAGNLAKNLEIILIDLRQSRLAELSQWIGATYINDDLQALDVFKQTLDGLDMLAVGQDRKLILIDDLSSLILITQGNDVLDNITKKRNIKNLNIVITSDFAEVNLNRSKSYVQSASRNRCGVLLAGDYNYRDLLQIKVPVSANKMYEQLPPGRCVLVQRGRHEIVQFATLFPPNVDELPPEEIDQKYRENFALLAQSQLNNQPLD